METLKDIWKEFIETAKVKDWMEPVIDDEGDLQHLRAIGAHPDLIKAAEYCFGIDEFYLAPTKTRREYTPEFFFKNALVIGDTGDGNFFLMVDAQNINSPIVYTDHDMGTATIVSDNIKEFFKGLTLGFDSPTFQKKKESCIGVFFDAFTEEMNRTSDTDFGLIHTSDDHFDYFDFSNARKGAEVNLRAKGKYSTVEMGKKPGVLILGVETADDIIRSKRRDWMFLLGIILVVVFIYFLMTKIANISWKQALFLAPLLGIGGMIYCVDLYFDFEDKIKQRKNKRVI